MAQIIHASIDENNKASGGKAGDQTGREVCIATFNPNKGWNKVLRCPDTKIVKNMIVNGKKLCKTSLVGYDQGQRNTLHTQLKKNNYDISKYIKTKVKSETDCSAFMTAIAISAGVKGLEYTSNAPTTSTMVKAFSATKKFKVLAYKPGMKLKAGDIVVKEGSHTVMYIG